MGLIPPTSPQSPGFRCTTGSGRDGQLSCIAPLRSGGRPSGHLPYPTPRSPRPGRRVVGSGRTSLRSLTAPGSCSAASQLPAQLHVPKLCLRAAQSQVTPQSVGAEPQGAVSLARCPQMPGEGSLGSPTLPPRLCPRRRNYSFSFRLLFFLVFWGLKTLAQFLGEMQP